MADFEKTFTVRIPLPEFPHLSISLPPELPTITLPDLPDILAFLGDIADRIIEKIQRLIELIPDVAITLRIIVGNTTVFNETIEI
jgi:hypothetical protein